MSLILYLAAASALLLLWSRTVQPIGRLAAAALLVLPLLFTGNALLRGRVYAPIDLPYATEPLQEYAADYGAGTSAHNGTLSDLYMQMMPWQSTVREAYSRGELPLWNPYMLSGSVLAANMQSAPWDPVNLIGLLLDHPDALTFGASITFFLAGFFTFAFARSLGCSELASLIPAAGYMFSATLAFFIQWPLGRAWVFLPMIFHAVRLVVRETSLRAATLLTAAFVLTILTGHPESLLHIVACGAAWGVFELLQVAKERRIRAAGMAAVCGVLALLLTAFTLLPFFEAAPQTVDFETRRKLYAPAEFIIPVEAILGRAAASVFPFFQNGGDWHPPPKAWEPTNERVGSLVLVLAILACVADRRKATWFFAGFAVIAGLAGLNAWPVGPLLHALPLFNIALNERLVFAAAFALSILAGLAVEAWPATRPAALRLAGATAASGVALAAGSMLLRDSQVAAGIPPQLISTIIAVELIPLAVLAVLLAARAPRRVALLTLLALILVQRKVEDGNIYPSHDRAMFYPDIPILRQIPAGPGQPFRIAPLFFSLVPNTAALYGLQDVRGYEAMTFRRLIETYPLWCIPQPLSFNAITEWERPFLSFLNVRYAIAARDRAPTDQWKLIFEDRQSRLFENSRVLPRAFVPGSIEYVRDALGSIDSMKKTADFSAVAWITAPDYEPHPESNGPGKVEIVGSKAGELELNVQMENAGWVVISEPAWSGWRTYVDGKRLQPRFANHAFLAVHVPAGRHDVRLVYLPESFTRGRDLSAVTFAALLIWLLVRTTRSRRRGTPQLEVESSSQRP